MALAVLVFLVAACRWRSMIELIPFLEQLVATMEAAETGWAHVVAPIVALVVEAWCRTVHIPFKGL